MTNNLHTYLKEKRADQLEELFSFLSIPSISALPEHNGDMRKGAEWAANALRKIGIENVELMETKGNPVVYGEWLKAEGKPTILVYGHYDVQPVDPVELWETGPFQPQIRNEKLFARGASDDKGQVFMHIKAIEALLETSGTLPVNFKFMIEGEEEIGSPNLASFVEENQEKLKADVIVISDTTLLEKGKPTIVYGLRGLCGVQIDVKGPSSDLHSGLYGGVVHNPIHALVKIVDSFHNEKGQVLVDGFYDRVQELSSLEKKSFEDLSLDDEQTRINLGVPALFGEEGFTPTERSWVRPTLEVNGIYGGFQGDGIKTVIPSEAHAKITCRLVPDQDPDEIAALLKKHVENHVPTGVTVNVTLFDKGAPYLTPFEHPAIQAAGKAYETIYGVPTVFSRGGGSLPIAADLDRILKLPVVLMGFGLPEENFHAPNEHFHLENYDKGLQVLCEYWNILGNQ